MICTFENGATVPRLSPAVEGSERTLICVVVVPSTGAEVGMGVGGSDVGVDLAGAVGGRVAVTKPGVAVVWKESSIATPHPDKNRIPKKINGKKF